MAQDLYILDELVLPRGIVYFDPFDASGNTTGEVDLGETGGASLSPTTESLQYFSSRSKALQETRNVATSISRAFSLTIDSMNMFNLSLFAIADLSVINQSNTPVVDEPFTVQQGRWYQLGGNTPARNVTSVVVTGSGGTPTHVLDTDYTLDAANGRIFIIVGGGIADDADILVDYTPATETRNRASAGTEAKKGALRVISDNAEGRNRDWWFPSVTMQPTGEVPIIAAEDAWAQMQFNVGVQKKSGFASLYVDDRAVG